jgi:glycosyltransferase involved in cell wall biosynthesis
MIAMEPPNRALPLPTSKADLGVVMAVRNESRTVLNVLSALDSQTTPPSLVVVVNDGSTDGTGELLREHKDGFAFELTVVELPPHDGSYVGRPELARVINRGLSVIGSRKHFVSYVMKIDGDHLLPPSYVESILSKMDAEPRLAVASGYIAGERFTERSPRGSGMVARTDFWLRANGLRFPLEYGWESWLYLKAQSMGFLTRSFPDVVTRISRPTSMRKGVLYGRGMYALGYFWFFAIGRCLSYATYSPLVAVEMLRGYVDHRGVTHLDVSQWVNIMQKRTIFRRATSLAFRRGFAPPVG